jgi:2-oxoglutarate ferredoxin oxidoreductase subunit gamma
VQNIVMLGFFSSVTRLVDRDAMREAVKTSVPAGTEELNLRAFDSGWDYFEEHYAKDSPKKEEGTDAAAPA